MDDDLSRLLAACQTFRAAVHGLGTHAITEPDPDRPADAVDPRPTRMIVKAPHAAFVDFEAAVLQVAAAASFRDGAG